MIKRKKNYEDYQNDLARNLQNYVGNLPFDVYGLPDFSQGLSLTTWSWGNIGNIYQEIGFDYFHSWKTTLNSERVVFSLHSTNLHKILFSLDDIRNDLLGWFPFTDDERSRGESVSIQSKTIDIAGIPFDGTMWFLPDVYNLTKFCFKSDSNVIVGKAIGLSLEKISFLLLQLVVLNNRKDLLIYYQSEFDRLRDEQKTYYQHKKT